MARWVPLLGQHGGSRLNQRVRDGEGKVNDILLKLHFKFQDLMDSEEGQDLVEYALVVALIAFGATAGMGKLSTGIKTAFSNVSSRLGTSIS
jgi:pilus assembly protein Flp/PilA